MLIKDCAICLEKQYLRPQLSKQDTVLIKHASYSRKRGWANRLWSDEWVNIPLFSNILLTIIGITAPGASESDDVGFAAIKAAIEAGCTYFNGGEFYGSPERNSLTVLNRYLEKYPEDASKILLNIKGAVKPGYQVDGSAENVKTSVDNCVRLLGPKGYIDQFEPARRDKKVPLEETIGTLRDLVAEGKIGGVALSEVNANSIREAAKITKIIAVEIELSLWETAPLTNGILEACKELDIVVIA
jgi:pyridoxine 4-dehydrogenase